MFVRSGHKQKQPSILTRKLHNLKKKKSSGSRKGSPEVCHYIKESEQPADPAVLVHVDLLRGGDLGQARHGENIAGQGHDEAYVGKSKSFPLFSENLPFSFLIW